MTKLKVYFYQPVPAEDVELPPGGLGGLLETIQGDDAPVLGSETAPMLMREVYYSKAERQWVGDFIVGRMNRLPTLLDVDTGDDRPLPLEENEGLGEHAAFSYFPELDVVALQSTRRATANRFGTYCSTVAQIAGAFVLLPVLRVDVWRRLDKGTKFRKFQMTVAGLHNPAALASADDPTMKRVYSWAEHFDAPRVALEFSVGHLRAHTLAPGAIKQAARRLRKLAGLSGEGMATKLCVSTDGADDDGGTDVLDLLNHKLREEADVDDDGPMRTLTFTQRSFAVREALRRALPALDESLRAEQEE